MKYENAKNVLPPQLYAEVEKYAAGKLIYVPCSSTRRPWGERTGMRRNIDDRNSALRRAFAAGRSIDDLAKEYYLSHETIKNIVYARKERTNMMLDKIFSLYSETPPESYEILFSVDTTEPWGEERYIKDIDTRFADRRLLIRIQKYVFASDARVAEIAHMIEEYDRIGYKCARIVENKNGEICCTVNIDGHDCPVFAEEYDPTAISCDKMGEDGRYVYHDDFIAAMGKMGSFHLEGNEDCVITMFSEITRCYAGYEDFLDEYVNLDLKDRIYGTFPALADKYEAIRHEFEKLRDELRPLWSSLPTSLFHPCESMKCGVLTDSEGKLTGFSDFLDGGKDACISFFINRLMNICDECLPDDHMAKEVHDPSLRKARIDEFIRNLKILCNHYDFTETEIAAAPIIYKLWLLCGNYYFSRTIWGDDESAAAAELDYIHTLLTSDEVDFESICK